MATPPTNDPIFRPLTINGVTFKNRVMRSSLGGRIDYYDGSMSEARIAWDRRFARGGVSGDHLFQLRASAPTASPSPDTRPSTTTAPSRRGAGW